MEIKEHYVKTNFKAETNENGTQAGYGTITIDDSIVIRNVRLMQGEKGAYLSFPSYQKADGTYQRKCFINNTEIYADALSQAIQDVALQNIMNSGKRYGEIETRVTVIDNPEGNLKAMATVECLGVTIGDIQVWEGNRGLYVVMPQIKGKNADTGMDEYRDVVYPTKKELREEISAAVLKQYKLEKKKTLSGPEPREVPDEKKPAKKANKVKQRSL